MDCIREGNGTPLQYSCLENPMDGGAWWAAVHGVAISWTPLSDFAFTFHFHALEKEMATHSSVLAWRIPGTGEPGGLPSMGSHRVGHDWSDLAAAAAIQLLRSSFALSWTPILWKSFQLCLQRIHHSYSFLIVSTPTGILLAQATIISHYHTVFTGFLCCILAYF